MARGTYSLEHHELFAELFSDHIDVAVIGHSFAQHVVDQLLLLFGHQLFVVRHALRAAGDAGIALFDQQPQLQDVNVCLGQKAFELLIELQQCPHEHVSLSGGEGLKVVWLVKGNCEPRVLRRVSECYEH